MLSFCFGPGCLVLSLLVSVLLCFFSLLYRHFFYSIEMEKKVGDSPTVQSKNRSCSISRCRIRFRKKKGKIIQAFILVVQYNAFYAITPY